MGLFNNVGRYSDVHEYIKNFSQQTQSGLKLDSNNNYDIEGKRLANVGQGIDADDAVVMHQMASLDTSLETKLTQLKADSLQVDGSSHMTGDLDLRGQKLILPGEINMNRKLITNLGTDENNDLSAVNMITLKKFHPNAPAPTHEVTKDIDLKELFNVVQSKQRSLNELKTHYDSLVSFEEVKENFLSRQEEFPMETQLNMNHNSITNLKDPQFGGEAATKDYADKKLAKSGGRMTGLIDMGTHEITNLAEPTGNNNASTKKYVDDTDKKLRDQISQEVVLIQNELDKKVDVGQIDMKGKKIVNVGMPTGKNDAASRKFVLIVTDNCLKLTGGKMQGQISMTGNQISNLRGPYSPSDAATKNYVDNSFITPSGPMKNVLQYVMDDVNQTSSEFGITVLGIFDFPQTPHVINKKAIKFQMRLQANDNTRYYSRLGLNMYSLPKGQYTFMIEFFPPTKTRVELNCLSTTINVDRQVLGRVSNAWKNVTWITKNVTTPNEYLMVDMKCGVDQNSSDNVGWLIVWGVVEHHSSVPSAVYDRPYLVENGKMVMETDLDLNGKRLLNYPKSKAVIFGQYQKATDSESETFRINNETAYHVFGFDFTVKKITLHFTVRDGPIVPVNTSVMIKASSKTQSASGVDIGNNAISYSFDFAVVANDEFELSLRNRGGIARANATILIEI